VTVPKQVRSLGVSDKFIRSLIVAAPGFGKTVLAGTAPNALFITTDPEGTLSAWAFGSEAQEWEIKDWSEIMQAYTYLRDGGIEEMGLDWILIDNASEAQNFGMVETMTKARLTNSKLDEFVPSQADYQRSQNMMLKMVKQFNDLPVNVLWTAWQKIEEDIDGNSYFAPAIHGQQGAIAQMIAGYMNVVGYGEVVEVDGKEVRRIWFTHHGPFRGKDRFVALGRKRDGLTIAKMQEIITAAVKKRTAERAARAKGGTAAGARRTTRTTTTKTAAAPTRTATRKKRTA
jgi:hypothetical protein